MVVAHTFSVKLRGVVILAALLAMVGVSHAQVANGDFSTGGTSWTIVSASGGTVTYPSGTARIVGGDSGGGASFTATSQTVILPDPGYVNFTLVSYSSTDTANWDRPVVSLNGTQYGISTTGALVANGSGVNNGTQASAVNLTGRIYLATGSRVLQFGVYSVDSLVGPGIATYDNVQFQQLTQSPAAQTTSFNTAFVFSGANSPKVATNSGLTSMTVTLSVTNGTLSLGSTAGITITAGANNASTMTFTGTPAAINTAMNNLTYTPTSAFSGGANLTFTATAGGNSDTDTIGITVSPPTYSVSLVKNRDLSNATAAGQIINYSIVLTNTGTGAITGVTPTDIITQTGVSNITKTLTGPTGDGGISGTLDVGEVWAYTTSHAVTQAQMDNGNDLVNTATFSTTQLGASSATASATTTITQNPSLKILKSATFLTGAAPASVGDVIRYTYRVENDGAQTISNVSVSDTTNGNDPSFLGGSNPGNPDHQPTLTTDAGTTGDSPDSNPSDTVWGTLAPRDVITFTADYTVTQADVDLLQ